MKKALPVVLAVLLLGAVAMAASVSKQFTIVIAPAPLVITTTSLPSGTVGTSYGSVPVNVTGGVIPYVFTDVVNGVHTLPAGLTIDTATGVISGTPTAYCFVSQAPQCTPTTIGVTDANQMSTSKVIVFGSIKSAGK